jgi:hypothetical protein
MNAATLLDELEKLIKDCSDEITDENDDTYFVVQTRNLRHFIQHRRAAL